MFTNQVEETDISRGRYKEEKNPEPLDQNTRRLDDFSNLDFDIPEGVTPLPLRSDNQQVVVFNLAHINQRPRSILPAYRVLGIFANPDAAKAFVRAHHATSDENVYIAPLHQLICITPSSERQNDLSYNRAVISEITQLHDQQIQKENTDFKKAVSEQTTGSIGESLTTFRNIAFQNRKTNTSLLNTEKEIKDQLKQLPSTAPLTGNQLVLNQKYFVAIHAYDIRKKALEGSTELQPLFAILFISDSEIDATKYAKYTAHKEYKHCNVDVLTAGEWIFPEHCDEEKIATRIYAQDKLTEIMDARRNHEDKSAEYKKYNDKRLEEKKEKEDKEKENKAQKQLEKNEFV